MRLRSIPAAVLLTLALPLAVGAQDFEGKVTYRASMGGMTMDMTQFIKGKKFRQEMSSPMGNMVMIMDPEADKVAMLPPGQPAMVMSLDEMRAMGGQQPASGEVSITPTGRKETIAGHACEHHLVKSGGSEVDICAATGMGFFVGAMEGMGGGGGPSFDAAKLRGQFKDGFFPLKISTSTPQGSMQIEAVTLERTSLSDDLFRIEGGE